MRRFNRVFLRVVAPVLLGVFLIGAALYVRLEDTKNATASNSVVTIESDERLRTYQETLDTDGDGMRDWLEELQGTDPLVPNEPFVVENEQSSDGLYQQPDTLTGQFAVRFAESMMRSKGVGNVQLTPEDVVSNAVSYGIFESNDTFYTRADIQISAQSDTDAIREWGNQVGHAITKNPIPNVSAIEVLSHTAQTNDSKQLEKLDPTIASFAETIQDMQTISVPQPVVQEHLDLLNTIVAVYNSTVAMRNAFEDPLRALVRLRRYQDDGEGMILAVENVRARFEAEQIFYTNEEPGVFFFSFAP